MRNTAESRDRRSAQGHDGEVMARRRATRSGRPESLPSRAANVLEIDDRQRTRRINKPLLRRITRHLLLNELRVTEHELCLHFVDAAEMARLNEQFLQHTGSTDVITFDHADAVHGASGPIHGEIFVSIPDALKHARRFGTTWQSELARYVIHGLLHLRGYDDLEPAARRVMKREETRLLAVVARTFPIGALDAGSSDARA